MKEAGSATHRIVCSPAKNSLGVSLVSLFPFVLFDVGVTGAAKMLKFVVCLIVC